MQIGPPIDTLQYVAEESSDVVDVEIRAVIDEQLHDLVAALVRGAHERRAPFGIARVHVDAEIQQHLHGVLVRRTRPFVGDALDPADAGRDHERRRAVVRRELRIGAVLEQ